MTDVRPVLIAGAGIAGLSLSLALARHGMASTILERRQTLSEAGAGIQLGPNAVHVLRRLGVLEHLAPLAGRPQAIAVRDGASARGLGRLPLGAEMEARFGAPYIVAHRADLQTALLAAVRAARLIRLVTGVEVADWQEHDDGVVLDNPDGRFEGIALVGADGLWSSLRRRLFPGHPLTYSGKMAARTVIPMTAAAGMFQALETGVWLGRDAHVVHYPVRGHREIAVVAILDETVPREGWSGEIEKHAVLDRLSRFSPQLLELLGQGEDWRVWSLYDPPPLPAWSKGRIALIGDAAHPILPFLAQGGAMAIEDAETLAGFMARSRDDPAAAFTACEQARRARVIRVQTAARGNGRVYHFTGPMAMARNMVLRTVPGERLMRRYDWLYGWNGDLG